MRVPQGPGLGAIRSALIARYPMHPDNIIT